MLMSSESQTPHMPVQKRWEWLAQLAKDNLRRSLFSILFGCLILAFGVSYPFLLALAEKYYLLKPRAPISDFYSIWLVVISFSVAGVYFILKACWFYVLSRRHVAEVRRIQPLLQAKQTHE